MFPAHQTTHYSLAVGAIEQVFHAQQAKHYSLAVAFIRTSVPCQLHYTLQPCSWGYQDKCFLPPDYTLQACGWDYQDQRSLRTRLHITDLRLELSGQVFPAHQNKHYRLAVGAIRKSVPCPPGYTLQACGWGYQDKCSLPTRLHIVDLRLGLSGLVFPCILQACGWGYQDKCSLPTTLHMTGFGWGYQD